MSSYNLTKAKNNPRLKKRILKATIRVKLNTGDFSAKRLIENSKFKELSFGNLNLRIDECNVLENINTELIESITELKSEGLIRISKHGWITPGKRFKRMMYEEIEESFAYDFIVNE